MRYILKVLKMAQAETEQLIRMVCSAALSRAVCSIAELGVADQIEPGSPQAVESLARGTGTHERSLYRILRFLLGQASHTLQVCSNYENFVGSHGI